MVIKPIVKGLKFEDLSSEVYREYDFGDRGKVKIEYPQWLGLKEDISHHGHRIVISENETVYVPHGWISLRWFNKEGKGPVQF